MYIPPPFSSAIFYDVLDKLAPHSPSKLLISGDLNNILDYRLYLFQIIPQILLIHNRCPIMTYLIGWQLRVSLNYGGGNVLQIGVTLIYLQCLHPHLEFIISFSNAALLPMVSEVTYLPGGVQAHTPLKFILQQNKTYFLEFF